MFAPTKTWRKWHRKINVGQRRYAVASALAASAVPALIMGRGHSIGKVAQIPLVVDDSAQELKKTKDAVALLESVGAYSDVERAARSRKVRPGKGKMRNRRHITRRGPLVVFREDKGIVRAFRNLPGVDLCHVDRLNLLKLAPGGHLGRFVVWTKAAFSRLDELFGTYTRASRLKSGFLLPRPLMTQSDVSRLINSDEIQSVLRVKKCPERLVSRQKKNPLKNFAAMVQLNPYALTLRRNELLAHERRAKQKAAIHAANRKGLPAPKANPLQQKHQLKIKAAHKKHSKLNKKKNYERIAGVGKSIAHPHFTSEFVGEAAAGKEAAAAGKDDTAMETDEQPKKTEKKPAEEKKKEDKPKDDKAKKKDEKPKDDKAKKDDKPKDDKAKKDDKPKDDKAKKDDKPKDDKAKKDDKPKDDKAKKDDKGGKEKGGDKGGDKGGKDKGGKDKGKK
jgi:large subunit ribosomal protein L4e